MPGNEVSKIFQRRWNCIGIFKKKGNVFTEILLNCIELVSGDCDHTVSYTIIVNKLCIKRDISSWKSRRFRQPDGHC